MSEPGGLGVEKRRAACPSGAKKEQRKTKFGHKKAKKRGTMTEQYPGKNTLLSAKTRDIYKNTMGGACS